MVDTQVVDIMAAKVVMVTPDVVVVVVATTVVAGAVTIEEATQGAALMPVKLLMQNPKPPNLTTN